MHKELEKVVTILTDLGWVQSNSPSSEEKLPELTEFIKNYNGNTIGIEIALEDFQLGCMGYYGICGTFIVKYEHPLPYLRDDIRWMQELIRDAEIELVSNKIPFRPTYAFIDNTEHYLSENIKIRKEYNLLKYEQED